MELATPRLVLRDFTADDWPAVLAYQADERYLRYYQWTSRDENDVRTFVQRFIDQQQETPRRKFQLAVTLPHDGTLIGNVGVRRKDNTEWEADIGYELHHDYYGRGYATEAAAAIVAYGFDVLGVHRVSASLVADNLRSKRLLERLGMRCEARMREVDRFKGRTWDALLYAILEPEWRALLVRRAGVLSPVSQSTEQQEASRGSTREAS